MIQMPCNSGLEQGSNRGVEKWLDTASILKVVFTRFARNWTSRWFT